MTFFIGQVNASNCIFVLYFSETGEKCVNFRSKLVTVNSQFQLFLLSSSKLISTEFLSKCNVLNFSPTDSSLCALFVQVLFQKEKQAASIELANLQLKFSSLFDEISCKWENLLHLLVNAEGNILGNADLIASLFTTKAEITELEVAIREVSDSEQMLVSLRQEFTSAATHAVTLFRTVESLSPVSPMYKYSLSWFVRILNASIENSNKSKIVAKRLRYIRDHLTYSLFCQVSNGLLQRDRSLFAFLLSVNLLVDEGKLDSHAMTTVFPRVANLMCALDDRDQGPEGHEQLPWLDSRKWDLLLSLEESFEEMKGECKTAALFWILRCSIRVSWSPCFLTR